MKLISLIKVIVRNKIMRILNKNKDFTIISNNCWGGFIYQMLKLEYNTPTIGLFFYANDYVKFCKNIKEYLNKEMIFIKLDQSKYYNELKDNTVHKYPIGKIDDIEIHFLHYKSEQEAIDKWKRRSKKINWNKMIFKFSQRDLCSKSDIEEFMKLEYKNKICFTYEKDIENTIYIQELKDIGNKDETNLTLRYFNPIKYLNNI